MVISDGYGRSPERMFMSVYTIVIEKTTSPFFLL